MPQRKPSVSLKNIPVGVCGVIGTSVAVFVAHQVGLISNRTYLEKLSIYTRKFFPPSLITSNFVHSFPLHLILNMASLFFIGRGVELFFGTQTFLLLFFLGSIVGGLAQLYSSRDKNHSINGDSAGVAALFGYSVFAFPHVKFGMLFIPIFLSGKTMLAIFLLLSLLGRDSNAFGVAHDSHIGGALTGVLLFFATKGKFRRWK